MIEFTVDRSTLASTQPGTQALAVCPPPPLALSAIAQQLREAAEEEPPPRGAVAREAPQWSQTLASPLPSETLL